MHEFLAYPWSHSVNPATSWARTSVSTWVERHALLADATEEKRLDDASVGRLAGLTYPNLDAERLALVAKVLAWVFIADDRLDHGEVQPGDTARLLAEIEEHLRVLRSREIPVGADAMTAALGDVARQLYAWSSAAWYAELVATIRRFWQRGLVLERWAREHGVTPDPGTYMATRVQTVGIEVCLCLAHLPRGTRLRAGKVAASLARRASWLTSRVVAYANDLFSYRKEIEAGDIHNYVHVLRVHEGLDEPDAMAETVRAHDVALGQYLSLESAILDSDDRIALRPHLDACRAWMAGALAWHREVARYAVQAEPVSRPRASVVADTCIVTPPVRARPARTPESSP